VGTGVGVACAPDEDSKIIAENPEAAAESVPVSETAVADESCWYTASPCQVDVGPAPSNQGLTGALHVTLLFIDKLNAIARSLDCVGVTDGVVKVVLLLTCVFPLPSTPVALATSAAIQTCSRCAESGVKTY
jgi:hypothetical protein